ncbi:MAG: prepilin peptidase [Fusobacteria bacterium]|nr:prepilin peptidase [Fusobacteriota bacterium]
MSLIIFIIGLLFGSFYNVCIYRISEGKSVVWPASHCPKCQAKLKPWENIPIVSFVFLRGKCGHCKSNISFQYPVIEFITGVMFLSVYFKYDFTFDFYKTVILLSIVLIAVVIDIKKMILPDRLTLGMIVVGLILSLFPSNMVDPWSSFMGAALFAFPFFLVYTFSEAIYGKEVFGFGDVKFAAGIGAFLGYIDFHMLYMYFLYTFILGAIYAIIAIKLGKKGRQTQIPFAPFMAVALVIVIIQFF